MRALTGRDKLIELIGKTFAEEYAKRGLITAEYTADSLLANGVKVEPIECCVQDYFIPSPCKNCSNHPSNGGSGLCNCVMGSLGNVKY